MGPINSLRWDSAPKTFRNLFGFLLSYFLLEGRSRTLRMFKVYFEGLRKLITDMIMATLTKEKILGLKITLI
jgi:hypothetical protein